MPQNQCVCVCGGGGGGGGGYVRQHIPRHNNM